MSQATANAAAAAKFETIPIALIAPSGDNPRKDFNHEGMHDLTASIRTEGVIEPIIVRKKNGGGEIGYEIIAGERRWRAAKNAGLVALPAIVRDASDVEARSLRLVENIQRADLTLAEECAAVEQLLAAYPLEQVCQKLGKSKPWVSKRGTAKDLPAPVKKLITGGKLGDLEVAHGLGQMLSSGDAGLEESAEDAIDDLANPQSWHEPVTRDWVRDAIDRAKESAKRRAAAEKEQAKAQRMDPDKPAPAERKINERERKIARLGAERKEFRDKAGPALFEALGIKPQKNSWNNPVQLAYGESLAAYGPHGSSPGGKMPATAEGCDFKITADADIGLLKRLASGLSEKPLVRCVVPDLTLDQAQRLSDALRDVKGLDLGYEVTITGSQVLKLLEKLAPGRQLMSPGNEQVAAFLVKHTTKDKASQVKALDLFKRYTGWAKEQKLAPLTLSAFGEALKAAGVAKRRLKTGWHYTGIALKG